MASSAGTLLFPTALGRCGIAWAAGRIVAVGLPETDDAALRRRMARYVARTQAGPAVPDAVDPAETDTPPPAVLAAIAGVQDLLGGEPRDLLEIELDMQALPDFDRQVYDAARRIPPGETLSYGDLARRIGEPQAAQAIGQALGRNPYAPIVPCHRVLAAGGRAGGFSAQGGLTTKLRLLTLERARIGDQPDLFGLGG